MLQQMGFTNVAHVAAGFTGWAEAGLPIERDAATFDPTLQSRTWRIPPPAPQAELLTAR